MNGRNFVIAAASILRGANNQLGLRTKVSTGATQCRTNLARLEQCLRCISRLPATAVGGIVGKKGIEMPQSLPRERLADLLVDPREDLDFEIKNWLDLRGSNDAKATFAKAALALANHGGGFIAMGLREHDQRVIEAADRPATFDSYSQDHINGIIQNYADPPFHCASHLVSNPAGATFPVIVVPGGHKVPIRARRAGPNGNTVEANAIYIRKPGPRSEKPDSAQDWDHLLARCLANRQDEMFDRIRSVIEGVVPQVARPPEPAALERWIELYLARWRERIEPLPPAFGPRCPYGYYYFAYEVGGELRAIEPAQRPEALQRAIVRHTGWPPFWYPTRNGIAPYRLDESIECWLAGDADRGVANTDPAHSDFWRISDDAKAFLLLGYQEDRWEPQRPRQPPPAPKTLFDITLPIWRVGEALIHAASLSRQLIEGPATIDFVAHYGGLDGRHLTSPSRNRWVLENRVARQESITLKTKINADAIATNLPEIVRPLLAPLYNLFDFFNRPMDMVTEELSRMRASRF